MTAGLSIGPAVWRVRAGCPRDLPGSGAQPGQDLAQQRLHAGLPYSRCRARACAFLTSASCQHTSRFWWVQHDILSAGRHVFCCLAVGLPAWEQWHSDADLQGGQALACLACLDRPQRVTCRVAMCRVWTGVPSGALRPQARRPHQMTRTGCLLALGTSPFWNTLEAQRLGAPSWLAACCSRRFLLPLAPPRLVRHPGCP